MGRSNGAEISWLEYLNHFQSTWEWDVKVWMALPESLKEFTPKFLEQFGVELQGNSYEINSVRCEITYSPKFHPTDLEAQTAMEAFFLAKIEEDKPDHIWAHYTDFFASSSAIKWNTNRSWIHLTDDEYPRLDRLKEFGSLYSSYQNIKNILVASSYMQHSAEASFPKSKIQKLMRMIEMPDQLTSKSEPEFWLFVNPVKVKGLEFMLELAEKLPDEKFVFVGNWEDQRPVKLPQNVQYIPRQKNLLALFSKAKALLMPSVWQEAFGRLPLEAMSVGTPVLASRRGGLPETLGSGGLVLELNYDDWIKAMGQVEAQRDLWANLGEIRVKEYRKELSASLQAYKELCESQVDAKL